MTKLVVAQKIVCGNVCCLDRIIRFRFWQSRRFGMTQQSSGDVIGRSLGVRFSSNGITGNSFWYCWKKNGVGMFLRRRHRVAQTMLCLHCSFKSGFCVQVKRHIWQGRSRYGGKETRRVQAVCHRQSFRHGTHANLGACVTVVEG